MWTPGYWAWGPGGYYWVPGAWVEAPYMGALWTPGYWGFYGGRYMFYPGHWGLHIGFYGGINYGFGYVGFGYEGGYWNSGHFFYNRVYNNITSASCTTCTSYHAPEHGYSARAETTINTTTMLLAATTIHAPAIVADRAFRPVRNRLKGQHGTSRPRPA